MKRGNFIVSQSKRKKKHNTELKGKPLKIGFATQPNTLQTHSDLPVSQKPCYKRIKLIRQQFGMKNITETQIVTNRTHTKTVTSNRIHYSIGRTWLE